MILDIHSHHGRPYRQGVISRSPLAFTPAPGQLYSIGIHPWDTDGDFRLALEALAGAAFHPQTVAIGECGIDTLRGGPMFRQMQAFRACIDISEKAGRPLVIHCVRAWDMILALKAEIRPRQTWIIHGFRGKPQLMSMLVGKGIMISYGEKFNPGSLRLTPRDMLLAETDQSLLSIEKIIAMQSEAAGEDLLSIVAANTGRLTGRAAISSPAEV